jgi:succinate dehydrogenase / fumarate reductase membrane anchor subunit
MSVRTPLGRVRGHGSAKSGTQHFWHQRITALLMLPLTLWFVWSIVRYTGAPYEDVVAFLAHPVNGVVMAMFIIVGLVHMLLGVKVVIEDYVPQEGPKVVLLVLLHFAVLAVAVTCLVSVLRLVV